MNGEFALDVRDLRKRFGKAEIMRGANLQVQRGERVAVIGPNGAGKSTLFSLISGQVAPTSGEILLHGRRIDGARPFEIYRRGLSRSFQITNVFARLSVFENVRCATLWSLGHRYSMWRFADRLKDAGALAHEVLDRIGLGARGGDAADTLSYAEQRALEIGLTIAGGGDVILLDEPTAGMSAGEAQHFVALIRELTTGKTLLMVEHDMGVVFGLADRVAVLVYGQVIAFDTPDAIRADVRVQEAYLGVSAASTGAGAC
ncbi:ABC transporter ATP-binding protein [Variovorax sp. PDNC026]|uniref:ABC transporter ATP-binding protein n=1 Tax=Variovorax sp. PDNC026 TaxID=2811425 RepID=UPI001962D16B|nr:ABC transporter ATP-binding protein [Variovorax sp. PDNC026]QRY31845.1 ABC transporter ATP-binding protein [Variovorax sp. PDNC026]